MERLTSRGNEGWFVCAKAVNINDYQAFRTYSGKAIDRLAAYENSGLEPCDYDAMRAALEQADDARRDLDELIHIVGAVGIDRLREMAQADHDGRIIVLPIVKEESR